MQWFSDIRVGPKLIGSFMFVALVGVVVGALGLTGLLSLHSSIDVVTGDAVPSLVQVTAAQGDVQTAMSNTRAIGQTNSGLQKTQFAATAMRARQDALAQFKVYFAGIGDKSSQEYQRAEQTQALLQRWMPLDERAASLGAQSNDTANAMSDQISVGAENSVAQPLIANLNGLRQTLSTEVADKGAAADTSFHNAIVELVLVSLLALALANTLGVTIARSIARPLDEVQRAVTALGDGDITSLAAGVAAFAEGNLTVPVDSVATPPTYCSLDEIGMTAQVVRTTIEKVHMAIGAYDRARTQLAGLIGEVTHASDQVKLGSGQLAQAAQQIGQASTQIARSIEEVARGTSEQSKGSAVAITRMASLSAAIQQVATGAEAQREAVDDANTAIGQLRDSLGHTSRSVDAVAGAAGLAARTAKEGGAAVAETISSIDGVRAAVLSSSQQVEALGKQSQEIGHIVDAIDDIAAQTNLLALNAAIEAARAGEHGKGFTVVAAEVRKLAERSSNETKEITGRIAAIQRQVAEVVRAMAAGSSEVEKSATLGRQAGEALTGILGVVEETNSQAAAIITAVHDMTASVTAVEGAVEHVAEVAVSTTQAAGEMRQGALQVEGSVESIAAVSEQSAAGAQEVSASTEEQTASVEEMSAGAQNLATLAGDLQSLVARFTLDARTNTPVTPATGSHSVRAA